MTSSVYDWNKYKKGHVRIRVQATNPFKNGGRLK